MAHYKVGILLGIEYKAHTNHFIILQCFKKKNYLKHWSGNVVSRIFIFPLI